MREVVEEWPGWWFGPDGQQEIFGSEDEVPEDWVDAPNKLGKPKIDKSLEKGGKKPKKNVPAAETEDDDKDDEKEVADEEAAVRKLTDAFSHSDLVYILEMAQEENEEIEFLSNWPKPKLAQVIVEYKIEVDFDEE